MPANFQDLTLPDGSTCRVLAPNRFTRMLAGPPPKALAKAQPQEDREHTPAEMEWLVKSQRGVLLRCVSAIRRPDGTSLRLTDKHFADAGPGELAIDALDDETLGLLTKTILELDKEVMAAASTFPQNGVAKGAPDTRHPGPEVRHAPELPARPF
jgi:hypothetical protein